MTVSGDVSPVAIGPPRPERVAAVDDKWSSGAGGDFVSPIRRNATVSREKGHRLCDLNSSLYVPSSTRAQRSITVVRSTSTRDARTRGSMTSNAGSTAYSHLDPNATLQQADHRSRCSAGTTDECYLRMLPSRLFPPRCRRIIPLRSPMVTLAGTPSTSPHTGM